MLLQRSIVSLNRCVSRSCVFQVISQKTTELLFRLYTSFDLFGESFQSEDILDWEIPETSCPDWSDQLVE